MKIFLIFLCLLQISYGKHEFDDEWWKYTNMYQVFLPTFKDSNGDGFGDLKGLISKLDHFVELGIEVIYIMPHYESPMVDSGYDISDFTKVNPLFGTMKDFDELIEEMNARGLKLMIDFVINHTSDKHSWFTRSINKEEPFTNFYVWKDPKDYDYQGNPIPPNNWMSIMTDKSAWTWNKQRKQFYFHQFSDQQPDLNLRNETLINEIKKIVKFWLDRGVAGFRFDAAPFFLEDAKFRDEPVSSPDIKVPRKYADLEHIYTLHLPESLELIYQMRKFVERIARKSFKFERIIATEGYVLWPTLYKYYGTKHHEMAHLPLNFALVLMDQYKNATFVHNRINQYLDGLPEGATPCWNSENHDKMRKGLLLNEEYQFIFTSMVMLLPGVAYLYYGQEIGVTGSKIRPDQMINEFRDEFTMMPRDSSRLLMQWDDSPSAGFSSSRDVILPPSPNYWRINVESQKQQKNSHYYMFKKMSEMRKSDTLKFGNFKSYVISTWVFAFTRILEKQKSYVAVFNLGSETEFVSLHNSIKELPAFMEIVIASPNSGYQPGDFVPTSQNTSKILILRPSATVVLGTK